ncbi:ABC transporter permease [Streptomyces niveiscabiei]|uniref:ABC transporter permease n=1 Tax=Streptomyces niveiscabiei TaxID=164115 RepID=A0ABW9HP02_9ACTN|nr:MULTISPECIES: ABC transporter permease [Streptomyces]
MNKARSWSRDLAMGMRFAFAGGREGWSRALLTAAGVGLGVALLLLAAAVPHALSAREARDDARSDWTYNSETEPKKGDNTVLVIRADTTFREKSVRGRLVEPEGPRAPLPPGVKEYPKAGAMVVSPKLKELLDSGSGKLLRERLPYEIAGTIGDQGIVGSQELSYYLTLPGLDKRDQERQVLRLDKWGKADQPSSPDAPDPILVLLTVIVIVVLLVPVGVFVSAAVRIGGERRDKRLAALRLVGSDGLMTRRIAAGEALAGALLGLVIGAVLFLIGRQLAGQVELMEISVQSRDLAPSLLLTLLVVVAVPAAAVGVTLFTLRGVVIEPLGVVRTARPSRRRLWWRLLLPIAGAGLLFPMIGQGRSGGTFNEYLVVTGVLLLLVGVTALLPWLVETAVARLGSGGVAWQLAVRRLQLSSGMAARMVNGVAVAVAGAIALQMLFTGVSGDYTEDTGQDPTRAAMQVSAQFDQLVGYEAAFDRTKGVKQAAGFATTYVGDRAYFNSENGGGRYVRVTLGNCASLREVAQLPSCTDGDVFRVAREDGTYESSDDEVGTKDQGLLKAGRPVYFSADDEGRKQAAWTVPAVLKPAQPIDDPTGDRHYGVLITPKAMPKEMAKTAWGSVYITLDDSVPDAADLVRNTAARLDPASDPMMWRSSKVSEEYDKIRTGLLVGATCVLGLIGASLLVSQLEQLRERRKLLSALVAFGTRRRTLSLSVLWQTAVPIALGLVLAAGIGIALGAILLGMTGERIHIDWAGVFTMTGIAAGVVLVVTLLSLPPLLRLLRPDGLRTE